jgi:putative hemolysin
MSDLLLAMESTGVPTSVALMLIPLLVAINGYFVAAEFALVAVRRTRVEELVNQGKPRAKRLLTALDDLNTSVAAAQLGITLASLALGLFSEPALSELITPLLTNLPESWQAAVGKTLSITITLSLVTYLHVVFGEQMPKIAALQSSEKIALWTAYPLWIFARFTSPVIRVMNGSSNVFLRWCGFKASDEHGEVHTVDELRILIEDTEEAGLIDPEAADYLLNVFALSNKTVRDVMVPWEKVMALEVRTPPDQVLQAVRDGAHTRMPVYEGEPNNIIGVVNTKDLFFLFSLRNIVNLDDARYDAQFLDPNLSVSHALRHMRKSRHAMAIVRDAESKVLGILTLEDVLEEIVGDIEDEQDDPARRRMLLTRAARRRWNPPRKP